MLRARGRGGGIGVWSSGALEVCCRRVDVEVWDSGGGQQMCRRGELWSSEGALQASRRGGDKVWS